MAFHYLVNKESCNEETVHTADDRAGRAIAQDNWPTGTTNMFFVFTPQGVESCLDSVDCTPGTAHPRYCAYHGGFIDSGNRVIYANMPYDQTWTTHCRSFSTSPNGNITADSEISTSSHEHFEAVNDPLLNAWYDSVGYEIGDMCAYNYGSVSLDGHNLILNGNEYITQQEWSNASSGCALSYSAVSPSPTATRTSTSTPTRTSTATPAKTPGGPTATATPTRNAWSQDSIGLAAYAGQVVQQRFMAKTDSSLPSTF